MRKTQFFGHTKFLAGAIALFILLGYSSKQPPTLAQPLTAQQPSLLAPSLKAEPVTSIHLLLGNPSNATENIANVDNYLMIKPQYALSYNNSKGTAVLLTLKK